MLINLILHQGSIYTVHQGSVKLYINSVYVDVQLNKKREFIKPSNVVGKHFFIKLLTTINLAYLLLWEL